MASTGKLPRVPNADPPRPDEVVRKQTGADLQNGWLARHGTLFLTDERLVFVPTVLDRLMRAKRRELPLDGVETVERLPRGPGDMASGGRRARMLIHHGGCAYELMVGDLDAWIDAIMRVYTLRARDGRPYRPTLLREGYDNRLYEDD